MRHGVAAVWGTLGLAARHCVSLHVFGVVWCNGFKWFQPAHMNKIKHMRTREQILQEEDNVVPLRPFCAFPHVNGAFRKLYLSHPLFGLSYSQSLKVLQIQDYTTGMQLVSGGMRTGQSSMEKMEKMEEV